MKKVYMIPESATVDVCMEKGILVTSVPVKQEEMGGDDSWVSPKHPIWSDEE